MTDFFSIIAPDLLLGKIKYILTLNGFEVSLDPKKYKLVISKKNEESYAVGDKTNDGEVIEAAKPLELSIQISKDMEYESRCCIEFGRRGGDYLGYLDMVKIIRLQLAGLADSNQ